MTSRSAADHSLTPAQWQTLQARFPRQNVTIEHDGTYVRIFANGTLVAKGLLLSEALREALRG